MKTLITLAAATLLSTTAFADNLGNGPDMYQSSLNDHGSSVPTAVQPGVGDNYGSVLIRGGTHEHDDSGAWRDTGDLYGSILFDIDAVQ
jgi:hypothetical protein